MAKLSLLLCASCALVFVTTILAKKCSFRFHFHFSLAEEKRTEAACHTLPAAFQQQCEAYTSDPNHKAVYARLHQRSSGDHHEQIAAAAPA